MSNSRYAHLGWGIPVPESINIYNLDEEIRKLGGDFIYQDSDDGTIYYLTTHAAKYQASEGSKPTFILNELVVDPSWESIIQSCCDLLKIPFQKPSWILSVSWDK